MKQWQFPLKIFKALETTKCELWARRSDGRNSLWFFALSEKIPKKKRLFFWFRFLWTSKENEQIV
ncbi:MAG: hypothetical protein ACI9Y7_001209 [Dokdonia sp.]